MRISDWSSDVCSSDLLPPPGAPAQLYLENRRIGHSTIGRYDPLAVTYERKKRLRLPALLLPVVERREIVALSRVFIDHDGNKPTPLEAAKPKLGDSGRGAVQHQSTDGDQLNLAAGFEDAKFDLPTLGLPG